VAEVLLAVCRRHSGVAVWRLGREEVVAMGYSDHWIEGLMEWRSAAVSRRAVAL